MNESELETEIESLHETIAQIALRLGADPDLLGDLWDAEDCVDWINSAIDAAATAGVRFEFEPDEHVPVVKALAAAGIKVT